MTDLVVLADVGRTHCRITDADRRRTVTVPSGASLADADGATVIADRLRGGIATLLGSFVTAAKLTELGVAATGALEAPAGAHELASVLARSFRPASITVTGDAIAAHAGALAGGPGVVLTAGTGAVAIAVAGDGVLHRVDGHGPLLGDDGSGFAIGREGLRAALAHGDGRSDGSAALARAAQELAPLTRLAGVLQRSPTAVRDIASFAPQVTAAAMEGDLVALEIMADAARRLAHTAVAALRAVQPDHTVLTFQGPILELDELITRPLLGHVRDAVHDVRVVKPSGDALDGMKGLLSGNSVHERGLVTVTHQLHPTTHSPTKEMTR